MIGQQRQSQQRLVLRGGVVGVKSGRRNGLSAGSACTVGSVSAVTPALNSADSSR